MDDREWQTFVTVVDEGNITRAAEKLFLSRVFFGTLASSVIQISPRVESFIKIFSPVVFTVVSVGVGV